MVIHVNLLGRFVKTGECVIICPDRLLACDNLQLHPPWYGFVQPSSPMSTSLPGTAHAFTLSDFDFALPPELVAQHPALERSGSRLLDGTRATPDDRIFRDLP